MRSIPLLKDNYYHVYNRGLQKQKLFHNQNDYVRFLFLLLYLQGPSTFSNIHRQVSYFLKHNIFNVTEEEVNEIILAKEVSLVNFCIMPNHFHLTLQNITDDGISRYLHRVSTSYAKYFNTKYDITGHVFEGTYKTKISLDDNYLTYLSAYIHENPSDIAQWKGKVDEYPWSSLMDYQNNRWGKLLDPSFVLDKFDDYKDYLSFVKSSGAKEAGYDDFL